ncbi:MAG: NAD(P)H-hydrate epimerase, partial [Dehalococcoidia bacterium]
MDDKLPYLTTEQMREVDRLMIEEYGILLIQMMENAGRNLAHLARRRFLDGDSQGSRVLVLAGTGGNGGGGLVCARHLRNQGADVRVFTTAGASRFAEVPR